MTILEFQSLMENAPVLLDGATGSNMRKAGMPVGVSSELWVLEHPEPLQRLQRRYAEAGSRIIYAPTFTANRIGLDMYGARDRLKTLNPALVALTREAVGNKAYVAGDITTTGKVLEPAGTMTYAELIDIYTEQMTVLAEAGVDLFVLETMLTLEETLAALEAAKGVAPLPVMCSLTVESDGSLLYGGSITDAAEALEAAGADAVGLNCSVGPDQLEAVIRSLASAVSIPIIAKPNAGLPVMDKFGFAHYSMKPDTFTQHMLKLADAGAKLLGGCCGTDPDYIKTLREALDAR